MKVERLLTARDFSLAPISKELIDKYKSSENMLRHARYIPGRSNGWFMIDNKTSEPIGYIIWEDDFIVAFEIFKNYRRKGYGKELLNLAVESGAKKLSVNKKNTGAIELYKKAGWEVYNESGSMLFMKYEKL